MWRGVLLFQLQMLFDELEISVNTPTISGHLIRVFIAPQKQLRSDQS